MNERIAPREGYAKALVELGADHDDVVVIDGDCANANLTVRFGAAYPQRFFDLGISECDLVGTGAGLALGGRFPFVNAYANFLTGRGFDQVRVSVAYSELAVVIVGHNAGTSAAQEGATHLPLEDIGLMRAIPNMTVIVPADAVEMEKAVKAIYERKTPTYLRVGKLPVAVLSDEDKAFEIGKAVTYREGTDVTLISTGVVLEEVLASAAELESVGISAEVMHIHTVKPIDVGSVVASASKTGAVVTIEEHSIINGLGSAVAEVLGENCPVPQQRVGTHDVFGVSGTMDELFDYFGLRAPQITQAAQVAIGRK